VDDPVAELAVYFQRKAMVPDDDLVGLTSAARAAGRSWSAIAAMCGVRVRQDTYEVITQPGGIGAETAAALLFLGTRHALEQLADSRRYHLDPARPSGTAPLVGRMNAGGALPRPTARRGTAALAASAPILSAESLGMPEGAQRHLRESQRVKY
jgi:hypothetical protein